MTAVTLKREHDEADISRSVVSRITIGTHVVPGGFQNYPTCTYNICADIIFWHTAHSELLRSNPLSTEQDAPIGAYASWCSSGNQFWEWPWLLLSHLFQAPLRRQTSVFKAAFLVLETAKSHRGLCCDFMDADGVVWYRVWLKTSEAVSALPWAILK